MRFGSILKEKKDVNLYLSVVAQYKSEGCGFKFKFAVQYFSQLQDIQKCFTANRVLCFVMRRFAAPFTDPTPELTKPLAQSIRDNKVQKLDEHSRPSSIRGARKLMFR
eukprot:g28981.t1